jgi:hypothetical protein
MGASFSSPVRIDPVSRAALAAFSTSGYLAIWIEKTGPDRKAEIGLRQIGLDGKLSNSTAVALVRAGQDTGSPRLPCPADKFC